jgi:hypothetical protein
MWIRSGKDASSKAAAHAEAAAAALGRPRRSSIDELGPSCAPGSAPLSAERRLALQVEQETAAAEAAKLRSEGPREPQRPLNVRGSAYALRSVNPIRKVRCAAAAGH